MRLSLLRVCSLNYMLCVHNTLVKLHYFFVSSCDIEVSRFLMTSCDGGTSNGDAAPRVKLYKLSVLIYNSQSSCFCFFFVRKKKNVF